MNEDLERRWLEGLWRDYGDRVFAYATRRVGRAQAEDVVADVFVVAWRNRQRPPRRVLPWLYGVARNVISEHYRANRRWESLLQRVADAGPSWVGHDPGIDGVVLGSVLDQLPDLDREVLLLTAWEGLEPADGAAVVGISGPAFRMRLTRARRRLRELLEDQSVVADSDQWRRA